jgi:hypothetical protein
MAEPAWESPRFFPVIPQPGNQSGVTFTLTID